MFRKNLSETDTTINIHSENVTVTNNNEARNKPIIVNNSRVAFFLLGEGLIQENYDNPHQSDSIKYKEKVLLIRSEKADLELIGEYINEVNSNQFKAPFFYNQISFLFSQNIKLSHISFELPSLYDKRTVEYTFCWQGQATVAARKKIQKLLEIYLFNISTEIKNNDIKQIELRLAPVLNICHQTNNIHRMYYRIRLFVAVVYILVTPLILYLRHQ